MSITNWWGNNMPDLKYAVDKLSGIQLKLNMGQLVLIIALVIGVGIVGFKQGVKIESEKTVIYKTLYIETENKYANAKTSSIEKQFSDSLKDLK